MRFGLFGGAMAKRGSESMDSVGYKAFIDYVKKADSCGYHSLFVVEHHFSGIGQVSATTNLLSYLAGITKDIRLGTGVLVLPWHNPVMLAEQLSTVDLVSNGRLDVGVGKGYRDIEFNGFAIPKEEANARYQESLEIIKKSWMSSERFSIQSANWKFHDIVVEPAPVQKPHPPIWVGAGRPESIQAAAKEGFNVLLDQFAGIGQTTDRLNDFKTGCELAGRPFNPMQIALNRTIIVTKSEEETKVAILRRAEAQKKIDQFGVLPGNETKSFDERIDVNDKAYIIGQPHEVINRLQELKDIGFEYILMTTIGDQESLRFFSEEVMSAFNDAVRAAE